MRLAVGLVVAITGCGRLHFDDRTNVDAPSGDATADLADTHLDTSVDTPVGLGCPAGVASGLSVASTYRAQVMTNGLVTPSGVTVAGGVFGNSIYVVESGNATIARIDPVSGASTVFVTAGGWSAPPIQLTTVLWDASPIFDGLLYVADQGTNADGDSRIFRIGGTGSVATFATGPAPGLNDAYGMAFVNDATYGDGLMITGDTDGGVNDWGLWSFAGTSASFSMLDSESLAIDSTGAYGGGLFAARPADNGWTGDDSISRIAGNGTVASVLVSGQAGVHAIAFAPSGVFGGHLYAADRAAGTLIEVDPSGTTNVFASGITWSNYDGNMIAFSPDGSAMYVADELGGNLICIDAK